VLHRALAVTDSSNNIRTENNSGGWCLWLHSNSVYPKILFLKCHFFLKKKMAWYHFESILSFLLFNYCSRYDTSIDRLYKIIPRRADWDYMCTFCSELESTALWYIQCASLCQCICKVVIYVSGVILQDTVFELVNPCLWHWYIDHCYSSDCMVK
jgi:hypothetical protein